MTIIINIESPETPFRFLFDSRVIMQMSCCWDPPSWSRGELIFSQLFYLSSGFPSFFFLSPCVFFAAARLIRFYRRVGGMYNCGVSFIYTTTTTGRAHTHTHILSIWSSWRETGVWHWLMAVIIPARWAWWNPRAGGLTKQLSNRVVLWFLWATSFSQSVIIGDDDAHPISPEAIIMNGLKWHKS